MHGDYQLTIEYYECLYDFSRLIDLIIDRYLPATDFNCFSKLLQHQMKCISVTFGLRQAFDGFCFKSPRFVWNLGNQDFLFLWEICNSWTIHFKRRFLQMICFEILTGCKMRYLKTIHLRLSRYVWGNSAVSIRKFHQIINCRTANIIDILYYIYTYFEP